MNKLHLIILSCFAIAQNTIAQLPELDVRHKTIFPKSTQERARLAYDTGDYKTAEKLLYTELEKGNFTSSDFLLFANILQANNKPALAREFYGEYAAFKEDGNTTYEINRLFDTGSAPLKEYEIQSQYTISNPTTFDARLYAEANGRIMAYQKLCDGNLIFRAEIFQDVQKLSFGSIAFYSNGEKAVASLIDEKNNTSRLYLFLSKNGRWSKPKELFTDISGNFAFPHIDEKNKTIYFSSDKAGSIGGYDLFKSIYWDDNFEAPISLGNKINSAGNDINPTVYKEMFYFISNGHPSKGGYDIYECKTIDSENAQPTNLTYLNTVKNELAFVAHSPSSLMVTRKDENSSRFITIHKPIIRTTLTGKIMDTLGNLIPNAFLHIETNQSGGSYTVTNETGEFTYTSEIRADTLKVRVLADGYNPRELYSANGANLAVTIIKTKPIEIIREIIKIIREQPIYDSLSTDSLDAEIATENNDSSIKVEESEDEPIMTTAPNVGLFYIILNSTYDLDDAKESLENLQLLFSNAELLDYTNGLYRIVISAGNNEESALTTFNEIRQIKQDVWILRPQ